MAKIATGIYTGDGAVTQAVAGVGFQPTYVIIHPQVDNVDGQSYKNDADVWSHWWRNGNNIWMYDNDDMISSLDVDGFTVGNGTGYANVLNINLRVYTYIAFGT